MKTIEKKRSLLRPAAALAVLTLLVCGLFFPLVITGLAQALMPYQANGEIVHLAGRDVGSNLIDNNFTLRVFFHGRNDSASRVDPDITLQDAYSQIPRIHDATGIPANALEAIVNQKAEGTFWIFGSPYVNVLQLNLMLIGTYPSVYQNYQ